MTERPHQFTPMSQCRHHFTSLLDQEWQRLRHDRRAIRTAHSWARQVDPECAPLLSSVEDLGELVILTQRDGSGRGNRLLLELVAVAQHDEVAGQVIVRRLLPGLISAASKYRYLCDGNDPAELAVGALWIAIRRYDHDRRRTHVAASLISDAIFAAFRQQTRRASATEKMTNPHTFDETIAATCTDPFMELAGVVADARCAGVPTDDLDLLRHLVRSGSPGLVARQRAVTPRTIRNHRDRAINRVRLAVAA